MEATAAQIHEHQEDIKQPGDNISGACHCGRVVFLLCCEQPLASKLCHCDTCKTIHGTLPRENDILSDSKTYQGAPFQWAAIVHKTDIVFLSDPQHLTWYNSGHRVARHELPCKARCTYCGTLILDEGRRMTMIFPTLLTFANENQKSKFSPQ